MTGVFTIGMGELLAGRADDDRTAYADETRTWTWREAVTESARRASMLSELREPGPFHVGIYLENVVDYLFWLGGATFAGAVVVGINPTRASAELRRDISHTDCQLIVTDRAGSERLGELDLELTADRVIVIDDDRHATALGVHDTELPAMLPGPDTDLLLLFTSGSTGAPKAVKCSSGRLADRGVHGTARLGLTADDVFYCPMPLFHGNALMMAWAPSVFTGGTIALRRKFSASGFLPDVRKHGATIFNYVGKALSYILATPEQPDDADNALTRGYGTEASWKDVEQFERRFGCTINEGYGMSEGGGVSIRRTPEAPPSSLGVPVVPTIFVADPDTGDERPRAEFDDAGRLANGDEAIGEIANTEGLPQFEGYYKNPEATAERSRFGWFWTGDLGYRDADGYFYFAGRGHDKLRVDGENFSAIPVERILYRLEAVVTAAVYAVPDPDGSDAVMVAIELHDGASLTPEELGEFLQQQVDLGTKWVPRFVRIITHMPVTGTNKINKAPLRSEGVDTDDVVWMRSDRTAITYRTMTADDRAAYRNTLEERGRDAPRA